MSDNPTNTEQQTPKPNPDLKSLGRLVGAWSMVGDKVIEGKEAFGQALEEKKTDKATALTLDKIVTHGKEGAVNGVTIAENGKHYAFCDVYDTNTKGTTIKSIVSYVIETKESKS